MFIGDNANILAIVCCFGSTLKSKAYKPLFVLFVAHFVINYPILKDKSCICQANIFISYLHRAFVCKNQNNGKDV
jgi:hypothetical protein